MDCVYTWRKTTHDHLKDTEANNNIVTLQRGETGNVWEGRSRHLIYAPSSDLLFLYPL